MAPLSQHCAKPALPLLDRPLVARLVELLADQGIERVVVNTHARAESIRRALVDAPIPVALSHEPVLRGGGGGIRAARALLEGPEPFLVLNGDMWLDLDVAALLEVHRRGGALVTLGLRDDPRKASFGTIGFDARSSVVRITDRLARAGEAGSGLFIGVHVLEPSIFERMPDAETFDILAGVYLPMLARGEPIGVWLQPPESDWWPVGSPAELLEVNLRLLARETAQRGVGVLRAQDARVEGELKPPVWLGAGAHVEAGARIGPWCVVGAGARVRAETRCERSLLLPGARPPAAPLRGAVAWEEEVWSDA